MGQDKKQLEHLLSFVSAIYNDPDNKEFAAGVQAMIKKDLQGDKASWSGKIDEIYEYCLNKNLHEQAEDLYKDFPLSSIHTTLVEDYVRMEEARRKNDFDEFGLHLYQQIEAIVNTLAKDERLSLIARRMYSLKANINTIDHIDENGKPVYKESKQYSLADRSTKGLSIADYVLFKPTPDGTQEEKEEAERLYKEKLNKEISLLSATEKTNIVLYFVCYNAMMYTSIQDGWNKNKELFRDIYNVRNHVHREGEPTPKQKEAYKKAVEKKSQSYLRFLSALVFLVEKVEEGYRKIPELSNYVNSLN